MKIPENHNAVMPYLILDDAARFLFFTEKVFEAKLLQKTCREDKITIMHAEIDIAGSTIMFAQVTDDWTPQIAGLFVYVEDADETFKKAVEYGAEVVMDLRNQDYGRSGGIKDPEGNTWWITSVKN